MARDDIATRQFDDARILFRNFSGEQKRFNAAGNRNFCVVLDHETAAEMAEEGWNIKTLKPREEGDLPQPYIQVAVSYKVRPPRVVLLSSRGRTSIPEDLVGMVDFVDIEKVDLIVRPRPWEVDGNTGVKAYLQSIYITIAEDALEQRYSKVPEIAGSDSPLQITAGDPDEIIIEAEDAPPWR